MFRLLLFMPLLFHLLAPSIGSAQTPIPFCGLKRLCGEMRTCAEAYYHFSQCGLRRLDADNDGIPCETICGKTHEVMNARIKEQPFLLPKPTKQEGWAYLAALTTSCAEDLYMWGQEDMSRDG